MSSVQGTFPGRDTASDDHLDFADARRRVKAIFIGSVGNLVEWYDFYAYAAFALYFAAAFFPSSDPVVQQLNAAVLFAAGFIVRPIGGWLFGHLADHYGRRTALMLSVLLMCFGSLMIAVTPTYASIGIGAPIMLGVARMVQGLSLGGEYGTSATYLSEVADQKHRGFYSSFQYVTLIGGQLCAILVLPALQQVFLTAEQLRAWGWRIPFVIGALLAIVARLMRRNLHETGRVHGGAKQPRATKRESSLKRAAEISARSAPGRRPDDGRHDGVLHLHDLHAEVPEAVGRSHRHQTTMVTAGSLIFALILQPIYGALSDRIGRKPLLIWFGVTGTSVHHPAAHDAAVDEDAARGVPADRGGLADRSGLHVDQRGGEGRAVPDQSARDRRRPALCAHGVDLRRHGGFDRAVVQVDRPRTAGSIIT